MADKPDLVSLVFTLKPVPHQAKNLLPTWWGRAAHALLLNTVRQYNPTLADSLHEDNSQRPFTVSTLMGRFPKGGLVFDQAYFLRLTAIQDELGQILLEAVQNGPLSPGATIELDYIPFRIEAAQPMEIGGPKSTVSNPQSTTDNSPSVNQNSQSIWSSITNYPELSATLLLAKEPAPRHIYLQFTSPTSFKSGGRHVPIPLPTLVFGSLLERWNAFAPIAFPPETKKYAEECLAVGKYKLSSRVVPMKSGGLRVGGVGEITYTSLNYDRYWMSVIGTLARFALFAGAGVGVTMGLGQCRMVESGSRISDLGSRSADLGSRQDEGG